MKVYRVIYPGANFVQWHAKAKPATVEAHDIIAKQRTNKIPVEDRVTPRVVEYDLKRPTADDVAFVANLELERFAQRQVFPRPKA